VQPDSSKKPFLAVYDYGQGGIWVLIDARSAHEIEMLYPELKVFLHRPPWLSDEDIVDLEQKFRFDVDAPTGWLATLVEHRTG
jgi:hypothetical protein